MLADASHGGARTARDRRAPRAEQVDGFYEEAVANGATTRGEPGVWTAYSDRYYAAFATDLHGNNVETVFHSHDAITDAPVRTFIP